MYTCYMNTATLSSMYSLSYLIFLSEFRNIHIKVQFHKVNTVFICKRKVLENKSTKITLLNHFNHIPSAPSLG